jgi:hypothetical protein
LQINRRGLQYCAVRGESSQDGSEAARHSDKNIIATENLILSYETLRYYEFANTP